MKTDLELLKKYLQSEIDCGNHKLFIFDENNYATELKTIDGFNAITDLEQDIANYVKITLHDRKEIERLNNIINELEKYIKENSWYYNTSDGCQWVNQFKVLDKLKELKESGNNG